MTHWPQKKPLHFGGNPDHVTLGGGDYGIGLGLGVRWGHRHTLIILRMGGCVFRV